MRLPILVFHICAGVLGMLSGVGAMSFRKGSRRHRVAGNVFFVAMLAMGSSAAYLGNVVGGLFACYMVATAWLTARRRGGETSVLDWAALVFALAFGVLTLIKGIEVAQTPRRSLNGVPAGMFFFLGSIGLLAGAGDVRMLVRGVFGRQRIARHLWRMCFAMFIATGSFFLGQQQVFPAFLRGTKILFLAAILPLPLMIFWLIRVRFTKTYKGKSVRSPQCHMELKEMKMKSQRFSIGVGFLLTLAASTVICCAMKAPIGSESSATAQQAIRTEVKINVNRSGGSPAEVKVRKGEPVKALGQRVRCGSGRT